MNSRERQLIRRVLVDHTETINFNANVLNAVLELLVSKGVITNEELRVSRLRGMCADDQKDAKEIDRGRPEN
jgi:hypothetical protein